MADTVDRSKTNETDTIRVRYWAAAKAAAGTSEDHLEVDGPLTLAEVRDRAIALHPDADRLPDILRTCSTLVGDRPTASEDPDTVVVAPGSHVEFLPPFAGG
ncbi:MoaD/ThiS family protein [Nocardioides sp. zg-579]|uniref:MoaD/ThiS family protein n=1 Tax=Nocardioides marmotae TaxID=2663857 RepID=A0A6I3JCI7_9ACTN|nr:MoaD/ThiS family protein [Nocardioides marmotae]MCR6032174.1 MoaD/ThiS family protein [Gordonia jinghuaiqii]MTB95820.1 MoaD/ThiS family protein [Nocardioides marmotae]QKE02827.1 MoaD/ThiS family protein [Nocardioides marmotae]